MNQFLFSTIKMKMFFRIKCVKICVFFSLFILLHVVIFVMMCRYDNVEFTVSLQRNEDKVKNDEENGKEVF